MEAFFEGYDIFLKAKNTCVEYLKVQKKGPSEEIRFYL